MEDLSAARSPSSAPAGASRAPRALAIEQSLAQTRCVSNPSRRALIVGAGLGGLAAAIALRGAGYEVQVFERARDARELGFALLLAPNAIWALRELGVAEEVRARGAVIVAGEMRRPSGAVLRRFDATRVARALQEDSVCVLRPVLHGALLAALGIDALSLGSVVTGFRLENGGVTLERAGAPEVQGSLLVGADGVSSVIRKQLHPAEAGPRRAGLLAIRGVARDAAGQLGGLSGMQYLGRGLEAGVSRASASDVYWFLSLLAAEPPKPGVDVRALLDRHLPGFHAPFRALVAATPESEVRLDDLREREPLGVWGRGPVTLLGDAAHAMLPHAGQGAAQALEDAVFLGRALRDGAAVDAALRRYEAARIPRTRAIVTLARRNARMTSIRSSAGCWLRDALVRLVPERLLLESLIAIGRPPVAS
jgi:FAD-dependent urate hydroxylase